MKTIFTFWLLLGATLSGQELSCPMHQQHTSAATHQSDVEQHGDQAMGFSHDKTSHHFLLYPDGGAIEVIANDTADVTSVQQIRAHLTHIASMFADGDFSTPMFVHSQVPSGVATMQKERAHISYTYEELPAGGGVRIRSSSDAAVQAIHQFLRFQIEDHHTGDSEDVSRVPKA